MIYPCNTFGKYCNDGIDHKIYFEAWTIAYSTILHHYINHRIVLGIPGTCYYNFFAFLRNRSTVKALFFPLFRIYYLF